MTSMTASRTPEYGPPSLLVSLEPVSFPGIENAGLESEVRHIAEHFSVSGIDYTEIHRHEQGFLPHAGIPHHLAEAHAILDTYHAVVVNDYLLLEVYSIQVGLETVTLRKYEFLDNHGSVAP